MKKVVFYFIALLTLTSCAKSFQIQGTSNISTLDGSKLYLKVLVNNEMKNLDSCDVVHGKFAFTGTVDTVRMATIFMEDQSLLPVVIEAGEINVKIDNTQQTASGTPLNDKLSQFFSKYNQIKNQQADLIHQHDQAIMNGNDMAAVTQQLNATAEKLTQEEDQLLTSFVTENFDNVLGPGVFFLATVSNTYPMLDPWIEDIMSKATDNFKNDPYVKDYYAKAQENQQIMNGMKDVPTQEPAAPVEAAPTPNQMAQPGNKK